MSEARKEERSWRPSEERDAPESLMETLMRELQRRRELARAYRSLTRDHMSRQG